MASPIKPILLFLNLFLYGLPTVAESRFYLSERNCQGPDYYTFHFTEHNRCPSVRSSSSSSFESYRSSDSEYKREVMAPAGSPDVSQEKKKKESHKKDRSSGKSPTRRKYELGHAEEDCVDIGATSPLIIGLADGSEYSLGIGGLGKYTAEELQAKLKKEGKPALSDKRIAQLKESLIVKED